MAGALAGSRQHGLDPPVAGFQWRAEGLRSQGSCVEATDETTALGERPFCSAGSRSSSATAPW